MIEQRYQLTLHMQGPILTQASGTLAFGVDAAMQRYRGEPVLNGSQIRGNIRHILHYFKDELPDSESKTTLTKYVANWFPDEPKNKEDTEPNFDTHRSNLDFDLFWHTLCNIQPTTKTRTRIQIDSDKGKVKEGALQVVEDLFPSGSRVAFSGQIYASFSDEDENEQAQFETWMAKALQWLGAIGSQKGVGYGRLLDHELTSTSQSASSSQITLPNNTIRFGIRLHLDRPFCLGRQRSKEDNRIISSTDIPGQVLKGVIAKRLKEQAGTEALFTTTNNKASIFDNLTLNHAKPIAKQSRCRQQAIPLNLAKIGRHWHQYTIENPSKIDWTEAPTFQPDWKTQDWKAAEKLMGLTGSHPERYLLVRTAIEQGKNAAKKHALFSLECVDNHGFDWCADVDLSKIAPEARSQILVSLQALMNDELTAIGKTRARATITISSPFSVMEPLDESATQWQITLQTAARMLPFELEISGINGQAKLRKYYEKYWHETSAGGVTLLNYFAQQEMVGSDYFHHRFRKANNKSYAPEWLTKAGSVFILQVNPGSEQTTREKLTAWLQSNLPAWESDNEKATWQTTVHIPQHGYGEITVEAIKTTQEEVR